MKTKKLLFAVAFAAVTLLSGYNYAQNNNEVKLSDLALANVEALASGETSEEFYEKTGCIACWSSCKCTGKDGYTYLHAHHPSDSHS